MGVNHLVDVRNQSLAALKPLLTEWVAVIRHYIERVDGDLPFWHAERPQVGFLSAAVWRLGGAALEEFGTKKVLDGEDYSGRNDLWFILDGLKVWVEAKFLFLDIDDERETDLGRVNAAIKAANDNAAVLNRNDEEAVGIVFVSPIWRPSRSRGVASIDLIAAESALRKWEKEASAIPADALAGVSVTPVADYPTPKDKALFLGTWMFIKLLPSCSKTDAESLKK